MGSSRQFTEAARIEAARIRCERTALKALNPNPLEVFVIRHGNGFRWEIRQFGAVTIERTAEAFDTPGAARMAGDAALRALSLVTSP